VALILFDIDGTLLRCGPQVRRFFGAALAEVFGSAGALADYDFAGKTDRRIVVELAASAGRGAAEAEAALPAVRDAYVRLLERDLDPRAMTVLPGVAALLARLAARPEVTVGLLTGNFERGAYAKLGRVGLDRHFPFGAFGDDVVDRNELPPVALARAAAAAGRPFAPAEALIVGDTPLDVACGRAHGVPVLAVATGGTSAERLAAAGADWVVPTLEAALERVPHLAGLAPAGTEPARFSRTPPGDPV
jgi:phosphoglycolate phosphatase